MRRSTSSPKKLDGQSWTVEPEAIWDKLNGYLNMRGMEMEAEITKDPRDFRFGDGVTVDPTSVPERLCAWVRSGEIW